MRLNAGQRIVLVVGVAGVVTVGLWPPWNAVHRSLGISGVDNYAVFWGYGFLFDPANVAAVPVDGQPVSEERSDAIAYTARENNITNAALNDDLPRDGDALTERMRQLIREMESAQQEEQHRKEERRQFGLGLRVDVGMWIVNLATVVLACCGLTLALSTRGQDDPRDSAYTSCPLESDTTAN